MFIVRDWFDEDGHYPYGLGGGSKYIQNTIERTIESTATEQRLEQKFFRKVFGSIGCFLMPAPGNQVRKKQFVLKGKYNIEQWFSTFLAQGPFSSSPIYPQTQASIY